MKGKDIIMKVRVVFRLRCENSRVRSRESYLSLQRKLKKYRLKETFLDDPIYRIDQDIEAYDEMICFCEKNQKSISFVSMWYEIEITEEERRRAVAFVPCFPDYYCEEYPDGENDYNECEFCYSKRRLDNPFFVLPKGYIKSHENECGMAGMEGTGELVLLPKLVEKLIEGGVERKYFQPVMSKMKKTRGYIYWTEHVLPEGAFKDPNYKIIERCPECGAINMEKDGRVYRIQPKSIRRDAVDELEDVNYTCEFYDEFRGIVVSKRVEKIIRGNVKYAEFMPVFLEDS